MARPTMKFVLNNLALLTFLTLATLTGTGCSADALVLQWSHENLDPGNAKPHFITVDGKQVECWVARSPAAIAAGEPAGYVLFFVGQGDRADRYLSDKAHEWNQPVEIWGMNYPGSGRSDGPAEITRVGADALAMYDTVAHLANGRPIFIEAFSLGTAPALCVAANRKVAGVILTNPPPLHELIVGEYSWWNLGLIARHIANQIPPDLNSIQNATHCTAPAIFLCAGRDETVPPKYQKMITNAYAGPKRIIEMPGQDHEDGLTPEEVGKLEEGKGWLWGLGTAAPKEPSR